MGERRRQHTKQHHLIPFHLIGHPNRGRFDHICMPHHHRFHFRRQLGFGLAFQSRTEGIIGRGIQRLVFGTHFGATANHPAWERHDDIGQFTHFANRGFTGCQAGPTCWPRATGMVILWSVFLTGCLLWQSYGCWPPAGAGYVEWSLRRDDGDQERRSLGHGWSPGRYGRGLPAAAR